MAGAVTLATERLVPPASAADVDTPWRLWSHPEVRRFPWDDRVIARDEATAALRAAGRTPVAPR